MSSLTASTEGEGFKKTVYLQRKGCLVSVTNTYDQLCARVATIIAARTLEKPEGLNVVVTVGSTPAGIYQKLVRSWEDGVADLDETHFFLLDEFYSETCAAS